MLIIERVYEARTKLWGISRHGFKPAFDDADKML